MKELPGLQIGFKVVVISLGVVVGFEVVATFLELLSKRFEYLVGLCYLFIMLFHVFLFSIVVFFMKEYVRVFSLLHAIRVQTASLPFLSQVQVLQSFL